MTIRHQVIAYSSASILHEPLLRLAAVAVAAPKRNGLTVSYVL